MVPPPAFPEDFRTRRPGTPAAEIDIIGLWLNAKTSRHTRRAYGRGRGWLPRFSRYKRLAAVTLADLQAWAEHLGQGSLKPASQNRALTAVKSLLSFAHETGYLAFNVGAAVKLRPHRTIWRSAF